MNDDDTDGDILTALKNALIYTACALTLAFVFWLAWELR